MEKDKIENAVLGCSERRADMTFKGIFNWQHESCGLADVVTAWQHLFSLTKLILKTELKCFESYLY